MSAVRSHLGAVLVEISDDGIAVEGHVGDQPTEGHALDQRRHADRVMAMVGQQDEAQEIAERIGQRQNLGGHAALGTAYRLALSLFWRPVRGDEP